MEIPKNLKDDLQEVLALFPKLKLTYFEKYKLWMLKGELDICDVKGNYRGCFEIAIAINKGYPYCVPLVMEVSNIIPRIKSRHISDEGVCCVDIDHNLIYLSKKGLKLSRFIIEKVYPYFANQLYYNETGNFAGEEYLHFSEGVRQYYRESLNISDPLIAISILKKILSNKLPQRNDKCVCGGNEKFKNCHYDAIELLKVCGSARLKKDIEDFEEVINRDLLT